MSSAKHGGEIWHRARCHPDAHSKHVAADVLDAWYGPSPKVRAVMASWGDMLVRCSPDTDGSLVLSRISDFIGVPADCIALGNGSSALIHRVLPTLAEEGDTALLLDPTYSEYRHVLKSRMGTKFTTVSLLQQSNFEVPIADLLDAVRDAKLVALVNPNNPVGSVLGRADLKEILCAMRPDSWLWVDETYGDFVAAFESAALIDGRVIMVKSLSKSMGLSGLRVGYLVGNQEIVDQVRKATPPWEISTPASIACIAAMDSWHYYEARIEETRDLRRELTRSLCGIDLDVVECQINCVLVRMKDPEIAEALLMYCHSQGVHLRDTSGMGDLLGSRFLRIAVRSQEENAIVLAVIERFMASLAATY